MAKLFINDEAVNDMALQYMRLIGINNKTEAVRRALASAIERQEAEADPIIKLREIQDRVKRAGFKRMADEKEFLDDLNGGI